MLKGIYFAPLVCKPVVITALGQYETRSGEIVVIDKLPTGYRHDFGCLGSYPNGVRDGWHKTGRLYATTLSDNDIIRPVRQPGA